MLPRTLTERTPEERSFVGLFWGIGYPPFGVSRYLSWGIGHREAPAQIEGPLVVVFGLYYWGYRSPLDF
jgi:hypothetical protein